MRPGKAAEPERVRFLTIGRVASLFGVSGEVRVEPLTDFPERFTEQLTVYIGEDLQPFRIESARWLRKELLLKLEGCDARCAEGLCAKLIRVPVEHAVPLPEEQYYVHQIIGLQVWATDGRFLGQITDIIRTGANDVYVVSGPLGEVLIPAIESVVKSIDIQQGRITVDLIEGLL